MSAYLLWTKYLQYSGLNKLAWVKSLCCLRSASALVRCQMSFHRAMAFPAAARPCRGPTAVKRSIFIGRYTLCRAAIMDVANYFIGVSVVSRCRRSKHRKSMASMKLVASTPLQQLTLTPTITLFLTHTHTHTHTRLTALFPGVPRWAGTRKVKTSEFYWSKRQWVAVASAGPYASLHLAPDRWPCRHPTTVFYRTDALPAAQPTASKHWRYEPCS